MTTLIIFIESRVNIESFSLFLSFSSSGKEQNEEKKSYARQLTGNLEDLNAENEISSTMAMENFILGFRLGMRIAIEALDEDDGNLTMTQEEGGTYHGKETGQRRR